MGLLIKVSHLLAQLARMLHNSKWLLLLLFLRRLRAIVCRPAARRVSFAESSPIWAYLCDVITSVRVCPTAAEAPAPDATAAPECGRHIRSRSPTGN